MGIPATTVRRWTPEDDERLRQMRARGRTYTDIARALRRTSAAAKHRGYTLGLSSAGRDDLDALESE